MQQILSTPVLRHVRRAYTHTPNQPTEAVRAQDLRWHLLDLVRTCRHRLALRDRDIAVLRGLLSLMPASAAVHQRIIFASNRVLIERCDGIDERTLRRRLAHLHEVGLIARNFSPNGKRYQVRDEGENGCLTYGIDVSPLFLIQSHLAALAEDCHRETQRIAAFRALVRDALYHAPASTDLTLSDEARLALRRSVSSAHLEDLLQRLRSALGDRTASVVAEEETCTSELTASDGQNDRHIQSSNKESEDSECSETADGAVTNGTPKITGRVKQDIDVMECLELAPTARSMTAEIPRSWRDIVRLAAMLAPAIGLKRSSLDLAESRLGQHGCALAVLGLVEAFGRIRNPEAYLRALANAAQDKSMDIVRMFRSLVRTGHSVRQSN
ncbi:MAG: plasmid replication protein RepC [Gemmobacter sp.]